MSIYYVLTADRLPIPCFDILAWGAWMESANRRVALDSYGDEEYLVSTVFLGLDHRFTKGDPVLFETAVHCADGWDVIDRYVTWAEAAAGHERILSIARFKYVEARNVTREVLRCAVFTSIGS